MMLEPKRHDWKVGDLWVQVDYEARAVSIVRGDGRVIRSAKTEDLGDGVLIDRNLVGEIIAVEVLGSNQDTAPASVPVVWTDPDRTLSVSGAAPEGNDGDTGTGISNQESKP